MKLAAGVKRMPPSSTVAVPPSDRSDASYLQLIEIGIAVVGEQARKRDDEGWRILIDRGKRVGGGNRTTVDEAVGDRRAVHDRAIGEGNEFDTAACQLAVEGQFFAIGEFDLDGFTVFMQDGFAAGDVVQDENVAIS